jgi:hypothetical protein
LNHAPPPDLNQSLNQSPSRGRNVREMHDRPGWRPPCRWMQADVPAGCAPRFWRDHAGDDGRRTFHVRHGPQPHPPGALIRSATIDCPGVRTRPGVPPPRLCRHGRHHCTSQRQRPHGCHLTSLAKAYGDDQQHPAFRTRPLRHHPEPWLVPGLVPGPLRHANVGACACAAGRYRLLYPGVRHPGVRPCRCHAQQPRTAACRSAWPFGDGRIFRPVVLLLTPRLRAAFRRCRGSSLIYPSCRARAVGPLRR